MPDRSRRICHGRLKQLEVVALGRVRGIRIATSCVVLAIHMGCVQHEFDLRRQPTAGASQTAGAGTAGGGAAGDAAGGRTAGRESAGGESASGESAGGATAGTGQGGSSQQSHGGMTNQGEAGNVGAGISTGGAFPGGTTAGGVAAAAGSTTVAVVVQDGGSVGSGGTLDAGGTSGTAGGFGVAPGFGGRIASMGGAYTVGGIAGSGPENEPRGISGSSGTGGAIGTDVPSAGTSSSAPPSCKRLTTRCGTESCCTTIPMAGGTYKMGRSTVPGESDYYLASGTDSDDEVPEHDATVGPFALDKYEVTVGRFREFVEDYDTWHTNNSHPKAGQGENPNVDSSNRSLTGWDSRWTTSELPSTANVLRESLNASIALQTWSDLPNAGNEAYPINFVTWYLAFAFCIWDDARLPTEAEWEYAASGGSENRLFPWLGAYDPLPASYQGGGESRPVAVGSNPLGAGRFGHQDLAGSIGEWVFDWYSADYYGSASSVPIPNCYNCVNTAVASSRGKRGGSYLQEASYLRAASRTRFMPSDTQEGTGFRCARSSQPAN